MPLFLSENDVAELLTMPEAIDALDEAFGFQGAGDDGGAENTPRARFFLPGGTFHHMAAALPARGVVGTKTYTAFAGGAKFYVSLFSSETGELLAFIEADKLGQMRTGAATGLAAKYMARSDAQTVGLLGTGWQAQTQARAVLAVRPGASFRVWSRSDEKRRAFCETLASETGNSFTPVESAEDAVRNAGIVVCATTAREPILQGEWLAPGAFVAGVGANRLTAREMDVSVLARADVVVVDDLTQARVEAAELVYAVEARKWSWRQAKTLAQVVSGQVAGRPDESAVCVFKSLGVALEDVAVARVVYDKARAQGTGREL